MKTIKGYLIILLLLTFATSKSQKNEVGIMIGSANLISDIGNNSFVQSPVFIEKESDNLKAQFFISGIYKRHLNKRLSIRGQLSYGQFQGSDANSNDEAKNLRNLKYTNSILEAAALFEYSFFNFNQATETAFSPYIFGGLALFSHKNAKYNVTSILPGSLTADVKRDFNTGLSIPFGLGVKYKYNYNWVLTLESGFRTTSQDDIDYSNPDDSDVSVVSGIDKEDAIEILNVGQIENKDWYVFTGVSLNYVFGRPKCYNK